MGGKKKREPLGAAFWCWLVRMEEFGAGGHRIRLVGECEFPSHGFVRVDEPVDAQTGEFFVSHRRASSESEESGSGSSTPQGLDTLYALYRSLQQDLATLENELSTLRRGRAWDNRWDRRYTKRMAVWGNLFLALWIFFLVFFKTIRGGGRVRSKVIEIAKVGASTGPHWPLLLTEKHRISLMVNKRRLDKRFSVGRWQE
jgi:hypothetical protein